MNQDASKSSDRPRLRVFVSSPGDVAEERLIAKRILDRLADEFAPVAKIESIFWEHEPLLATDTFQTQIIRPSETDIVVCILWSRLGTRLPQQFTHAGRLAVSTPARNSSLKTPWKAAGNTACPICWFTARPPSR